MSAFVPETETDSLHISFSTSYIQILHSLPKKTKQTWLVMFEHRSTRHYLERNSRNNRDSIGMRPVEIEIWLHSSENARQT